MARKEFNLTVGTVQLVSVASSWCHEAAVNTAVTTIDMSTAPISTIVYIINDDTVNDLFVAFDTVVPTAAIANGATGVIRIKAGEQISNVPRYTQKIKLIRSAGSGVVRFMGV